MALTPLLPRVKDARGQEGRCRALAGAPQAAHFGALPTESHPENRRSIPLFPTEKPEGHGVLITDFPTARGRPIVLSPRLLGNRPAIIGIIPLFPTEKPGGHGELFR